MTPELRIRIDQIRHGIVPEGYTKTKVGTLPRNWKTYRIDECLEQVSEPVDVKPDVLYTQIGIRSHGKGLFYKEPVTGESLGNKSVFWIQPNCFILNIVFAWEQAIAKTAESEIGMIGSHRFPMYRPIDGKVDIDYLIYFLLTKRGTDILEAASPGGAGRNRTLGQDRFMKSRVVLPPLAEQQKIAAILSTQDKLIALKEKRIAEKQKQKKYLMQQLLTGKKRLAGFNGEWEIKRISYFADIISGGTPNTEIESYWNGNIPWCTPADISKSSKYISKTEKYISMVGLENSSSVLLPKGSILMCTRASIGPRCINCIPMATNQGIKSIWCKSKEANREFVYYLLDLCVADFVKLSSGSTFLELSKYDLEKYEVLLPPIKEQEAIAEIITAADCEIDLLQQDLEQEKKKKKALMQLLLMGIVRV